MNKRLKLLPLLWIMIGLLTAAVCTVRSLLLFLFYAPERQHFQTAAAEPILAVSVLLPILLFAAVVFWKKLAPPAPKAKASLSRRIATGALGVVTAAFAGYGLVASVMAAVTPIELVFAFLAHAVLLLYAVLLLLDTTGFYTSEDRIYLYGTVAAVAPCLYAMYLYFEGAHFMNNPNILLSQLAFLALSLYLLADTRARAEKKAPPPYLLFIAATAFFLAAAAGIPSLLFFLFRGEVLAAALPSDLFLLFFAAYIAVKHLPVSQPEANDQ